VAACQQPQALFFHAPYYASISNRRALNSVRQGRRWFPYDRCFDFGQGAAYEEVFRFAHALSDGHNGAAVAVADAQQDISVGALGSLTDGPYRASGFFASVIVIWSPWF
jgi:hypothetical protein